MVLLLGVLLGVLNVRVVLHMVLGVGVVLLMVLGVGVMLVMVLGVRVVLIVPVLVVRVMLIMPVLVVLVLVGVVVVLVVVLVMVLVVVLVVVVLQCRAKARSQRGHSAVTAWSQRGRSAVTAWSQREEVGWGRPSAGVAHGQQGQSCHERLPVPPHRLLEPAQLSSLSGGPSEGRCVPYLPVRIIVVVLLSGVVWVRIIVMLHVLI